MHLGQSGTDNLYQLYDVDCVAGSDCWAAGVRRNGNGSTNPLLEHWNGAVWTTVPAAWLNTPQNAALVGITCISSTDCWTVGNSFEGSSTLIEHWDGNRWAIVNSASFLTGSNYLNSVACNSSSDCWVVGFHDDQTLIEHWDGIEWAIVASPNKVEGPNTLNAISCASPADCWAVGDYDAGNGSFRTLTEHWNGSTWDIVTSADSGPGFNGLYDVVCPSSDECWSVGYAGNGPLVQQWNGNAWEAVSVPVSFGLNWLYAITCDSASDCWAVGSGSDDNPLIEHWDGKMWTLTSSPSLTPERGGLYDVACISAQDCWGVGGTDQAALEEHWDGNAWSFVPTPPALSTVASRKAHGNAGSFDLALPGVECRKGDVNYTYEIVFRFTDELTNVTGASASAGTVTGMSVGPDPHLCTVNLAAVPIAQPITVTLNGVQSPGGSFGNVSTVMALLIGDTNGNGLVNASDSAQTKASSGESVGSQNFRRDIDANGTINATDSAIVKSNIGLGLP